MPADTPDPSTPCPECGVSGADERTTEDYILEDGTERRITYCTACCDERADGSLRYTVISESYIRTEIDVKMNGTGPAP